VNSNRSYDLSPFFVDDDGNPITMTVTSSFEGGSAVSLPAGILTLPNLFTIAIAPTKMEELGVYLITVRVSDLLEETSS
jgi:hypothetical protein